MIKNRWAVSLKPFITLFEQTKRRRVEAFFIGQPSESICNTWILRRQFSRPLRKPQCYVKIATEVCVVPGEIICRGNEIFVYVKYLSIIFVRFVCLLFSIIQNSSHHQRRN